ncbi:MAG: addiction module protein [Longimicrobiaceae bacterium]
MSSSTGTAPTVSLEKIEEELLALPREAREHLAKVLESSLGDGEVEMVWDEEADRRYRAFLAGELTAVPAREALAQLRAQLRK